MPEINVTKIRVADAVRMLDGAGSMSVTKAMIRDDIKDGAPINDDGTLNLIHYAAWLTKESPSY